MTHPILRGLSAALLLSALAVPRAASAWPSPPARDALIDLAYLTQTPQLCGAAALAMVLRYWGATDVFPQDFAALVDEEAGGIRTSALTRAATARGYVATPLALTSDTASSVIRAEVNKGRPLIALVEDSPRVYHYVVIVGITDREVVLHDPARAPYRVLARAEFERQWAAAGRWMLLVVPGSNYRAPASPVIPVAAHEAVAPVSVPSASACDGLVAESVSLAVAGRAADAEAGLLTATSLCPSSAAGWRELGGLRFVQQRYRDSATSAAQAVQLSPADRNAWELLASSRFMIGNVVGALAAWNHLDEPHVDTVLVQGADRTPQPLVVRITGLEPRALLTPDAFVRAGRRLAELPATAAASIQLRPVTGGTANVVAAIVERPRLPTNLLSWAAVGVNAGFAREIRLNVASLFDQGDLLSGAYRFRANRPRVAFAFALPSPAPLPGVMGIDVLWEQQAYAPLEAGLPLIDTERRRVDLRLLDWATGWLRWQVSGGLDRFSDTNYATIDGSINTRWFRDRVAAIVRLAHWTGVGDAPAFSRADASVSFRSTLASTLPVWFGQVRFISLSNDAPLLIWPIASSSDSREVLLRAHPLYDNGIITDDVIGRQMGYATLEYQRPLYRSAYGSINVAGFADLAQASSGPDGADAPRTQMDIGAGVRVNAPGLAGQLRLDVAYGLRTKDHQFSAGYVIPWGQ